ncbi:MAG: PilZ domain-containing protein [Phycisphaerae bacterium]|nr:PilZ domain-containing protein [Phycisphaerae bacterium]
MSENPADRRKYPRFDLEYTIQLISPLGDMVITALTSNISDGGLRLPLPADSKPDCGSEVQVNLTIRRGDGGDVEMYTGVGKVIRHHAEDKDGIAEIALQFFAPMDLRLQSETPDASVML